MIQSAIEDFLLSSEFFRDPYPFYQQMRDHTPVYWSPKLSSWLVTRYADCQAMLDDPETFSSSGRVAYLLDQLPADMQARVEPLRRHYAVGLAHSDRPAHTRLRNVMRKGISPAAVHQQRTRIEAIVDELLTPLESREEIEFIQEFAYPLPATVIVEMIGAPVEDIEKFKGWADDIAMLFEYGGKMTPEAADIGVKSLKEIRAYISDLIEHVKEHPGDNIMSLLVDAESDEKAMSLDELINTAVTLFVAGHETTTNLLGLGLKNLLSQPERYKELRENPALIPSAIEELLRFDAVIPRAWRIANQDTEIAGIPIQKGQMVMAMLGSANRDEAKFDEPDLFNPHRKNNRHFGFGRGIHVCLGAPLARLEVSVALEQIIKRFPNLALKDQEFQWRGDMAIRGLKELHLTHRPE